MGFTLRFLLGVVLISLCCSFLEAVDSNRPVRQVSKKDEEGKPADKLQKIESKSIGNLKKGDSKPKTDVSTEDNKKSNLETQNSLESNKSSVKLHKSEPYKKIIVNEAEAKVAAEDIAKSIDINKYLSKDFHNKNNVYKLPPSSSDNENEKFINPDYDYHSSTTTHKDKEHIDYSSELTTPKSTIFDQRYKEAVESVEQKLEQIDHSHEDSSESKEDVSVDELYEQTKNNDTKANLNYINYKHIISNDTTNKNALHKDLVLEAGTNLDFHSSYNKTVITDENDSGNNTIVKEPVKAETVQASTVKSALLTTRKSLILTKPPSNKNASHISLLSNKIERERLKSIEPIHSNSLATTEKITTEKAAFTKRTLIDITKRGSVKFADYAPTLAIQSSTTPATKKEDSKANDALVQENQIVQVQVEAPKNLDENFEVPVIDLNETITTEVTRQDFESTTEETTPISTLDVTVTVTETEATTIEPATTTNSEDLTTESLYKVTDSLETTETTISTTLNTTIVTTETIETTTYAGNIENTSSELSTTKSTTEESIRTSKGVIFEDISTLKDELEITETTTTDLSTTESVTLEPTTTDNNIITNTHKNEEDNENVKDADINYRTVPTTNEAVTEESIPETDNVSTDIGIFHIETVDNRTTLRPELRYPTTDTETTSENSTTPSDSELHNSPEDNSGTIAAITISAIGAVCLVLLAGLLVIMKKRQKRFNYGQRCTPVSLDDYSMDNISVQNSVRRKVLMRSSKRSYGNPAFEDPSSVSHPLNFPTLSKFSTNIEDMKGEFEEIPQITARTNELPDGCDTKNRYANVIPLPETRVFLTSIEGYPNSDYINANYVTGPKNTKGYYIACQAPMQNTVDDFWRMIWEQQCRVILMVTHLFENGVEKCYDYLPESEVVDCHRLFGDFQVTLKKREVKDKYVISTVQLKNMVSNSWREITHFWYIGWPEKGVPSEANSLIAFLIEARSYMKSSSIDRKEITNGNVNNGAMRNEINPVVVHCSPGTGRTGVVIACDIAIREFEQTRLVDIPRIVYRVRRDRASSVQTKEQYAYIYKVVNLYAAKLTGGALDSL